jgi:hypothetical protein
MNKPAHSDSSQPEQESGETVPSGMWCFICGWDAENCTMCRPEEPGQLDLFEVGSETD